MIYDLGLMNDKIIKDDGRLKIEDGFLIMEKWEQ